MEFLLAQAEISLCTQASEESSKARSTYASSKSLRASQRQSLTRALRNGEHCLWCDVMRLSADNNRMSVARCSLAWLYMMLLRLASSSQQPPVGSCVAPTAMELPIEVDGQRDTVRLRPDEPLTRTARRFCEERHGTRFASEHARSQCIDGVHRYLERRRSELWCAAGGG